MDENRQLLSIIDELNIKIEVMTEQNVKMSKEIENFIQEKENLRFELVEMLRNLGLLN